MCQPEINTPNKHVENNNNKSWLGKIWPLPTPLVIALLPLLPTSFYLNRGYTVWFHLTSIVYFLTRSPFVRKILILQGLGICLGWYAAIAYDWFVDGTFCHTLYRNMPASMLPHMIQAHGDDGGYTILNTYSSWAAKAMSHILDTIGHPGLACLFYKLHTKWGGTWNDILSWPIIVSAWHFSRTWSLVHSYYNTGTARFWYYGDDVYVLNNLNAYLIAYVVEGVCFGVAILCRVYWDRCADRSTSLSLSLPPKKDAIAQDYHDSNSLKKNLERMPALTHSDSTCSTSSMMQ